MAPSAKPKPGRPAGDAPLLRILAAGGADRHLPARGNYAPLMAAAGGVRRTDLSDEEKSNALEAVKLITELGTDVNAVNAAGQTAMHAAAFIGADAIVKFLADKGANVDAKDKRGQTPWSLAQGIAPPNLAGEYGHHPGTASLLVERGAIPWTVEQIDAFRRTD